MLGSATGWPRCSPTGCGERRSLWWSPHSGFTQGDCLARLRWCPCTLWASSLICYVLLAFSFFLRIPLLSTDLAQTSSCHLLLYSYTLIKNYLMSLLSISSWEAHITRWSIGVEALKRIHSLSASLFGTILGWPADEGASCWTHSSCCCSCARYPACRIYDC